MSEFKKTISHSEREKINELQKKFFSQHTRIFEEEIPEGVPERLAHIATTAEITQSDTVADVGTGTGILIPFIQHFSPQKIYACDLTPAMLKRVGDLFPSVETLLVNIRDCALPDASVDVFFFNACYPNIVDKHLCFVNVARMCKPQGRLVISHPMGRKFVQTLQKNMPFPIDNFPADRDQAEDLFKPYGFHLDTFIDEPELYILKFIYSLVKSCI